MAAAADIPGVTVESGIGWTARETGLDQLLAEADLVITGEGRFDDTSLMGKGTGYVVRRAEQRGIPAVVVCGQSPFEMPPAAHPKLRVIPLLPNGTAMTPEIIRNTPAALAAKLSDSLEAIRALLNPPDPSGAP